MFEELPSSMALQLTLALKEDLIINVPMFHSASARSVLKLVNCLETCIAVPGEAVIKQSARGHRM
jgi:hypothetical protein